MRKIKILAILFACFLLKNLSTYLYAQCSVTMTVATTSSDCPLSGSITATITAAAGTNLNNLNMAECELRYRNSAGQWSQWSTWPQVGSNSNIRKLDNVGDGVYTVEFQAICNVSPYTTATASVSNVTVGGHYNSLIATALPLRKSMSCKATGQIAINISGGKSPYQATITSAPSGYTGATTFNFSTTTYTIDNVAGGNYTIVISDDCGTVATRNIAQADMTLSSDMPTTVIYNYLQATTTNDCNTAIPYTTVSVSSDWTYYWSNSSDYYEYAYVFGTGTPTSWTPLPNNDKRPVVTLPSNYNTFCNSGQTITFYLRPIGCSTATPRTQVMNTSTYLCSTSTAISTPKTYVIDGNCDYVQLGAEVNQLVGMCYPLNWEITNKTTGGLVKSGTLTHPNRTISTPGAGQPTYQRGINYEIKVTDANGRVFTSSWSPGIRASAAIKIDVSYANGYYCSQNFGTRDIRLYVDAEDMFFPGTIVKYVNGPQNLMMGGPGSTYVIPAGTNRFWPNSARPHIIGGREIMKPGLYEFEIITNHACISEPVVPISITLGNYYTIENTNFTYTTNPTCNGLQVILNGKIQMTDGNGNYTDQTTYYRILRSDNGAIFGTSNYTVGSSTYPTLPWTPGNYTLGVFTSTSTSCNPAIYEFTVHVAPGERLSIDPLRTSHYICAGKTLGDVYVKAVDGIPNTTKYPPSGYRYTITAAGTTSPILAQNNTGDFPDFGVHNALYDIKVEDDCTDVYILKNVRMLDLNNANVAFALNDGYYCEDGLVELFCVSLGTATYSWSGPPGFVFPQNEANKQFPKFPASTAVNGTYSVTVQPARCPNPSIGNVDIEIVHLPVPPLKVHSVTVCRSSTASSTIDVVSLSGAVPDPDCTLNWFDEFGILCEPPTAVSNYVSGSYGGKTLHYFVSQVKKGACESVRYPVEVNIIACGGTTYLPALTPAVSATSLCAGSTATLSVSGTAFGDILFGGYAHGVSDVVVPPITSNNPNGQLVVKFDSDGSVAYEGFDLAISCTGVPGGGGSTPIYRIPVALNTPLTVTACSGRIQNTLQQGSDLYAHNSHGYIILNPATTGAKVTVKGTGQVESGYDYLTIFNGVTTLATGSSGLNVGYWVSNNPNIAKVNGNTVIPVGAGSVTFSFVSGSGIVTTQEVTIVGDVKISYAKNSFCTNEGTQVMRVNGLAPPSTGGSITVTPSSGLSIVTTAGTNQGTITPSGSTPNTYRIIYSQTGGGCTVRDTTWVTIVQGPIITNFAYPGTTLCSSISTPQMPTLSGTLHSGGTFYCTPTGLALNPLDGAIVPSSSTLGTYSVTYTTPTTPNCGSDTKTISVTIGTGTPITISYPNPIGNNNPVCQGASVLPNNSTNYTPTLSPSTTGTWEIDPPSTLSFVQSSGRISVSRSTAAGIYSITFKPASSTYCPATYVYNVITPPDISYPNSMFCTTDTQLKEVTFTGGGGAWENGTFSSTSGLSINATTGTIDPNTSTPGTYTVSYNPGAASCNATTSVTIQNTPPTATPGAITVPANICKNSSLLAFSVATTPALPTGAIYQWTFPVGWEITAGQGTRTPTVTSGATGGTVSVEFANSCGAGPASSTPVTVLTTDAPAQPNPINGPAYACRGNNNLVTFEIDPVPGATGYTWLVSPTTGWTVDAGAGTTRITYRFSNQTVSATVSVKANNSCGTGPAASLYVTVSTSTPSQPSTVTGPTSVCRGDIVTYTSSTVANAIYYVWEVPTGWEIISGNGTNIITVKVTNAASLVTNAQVRAAASNGCNSNFRNSSNITVGDVPAQPSPISGTGVPNVCANMEATFSVTNVAGTTYTWTIPEEWQLFSGQGTNQITVLTSQTGGIVRVMPANGCGEGPEQSTEVTMLSLSGPPSQPGPISGSLIACRSTTGTAIYEVAADPYATSYTWSLSPATGWTVNSATVPNTNIIIYNLSSTAISTTISVTANNTCGSSAPSTLSVTVPTTNPSQPNNITASGSNPSPCKGSGAVLTFSTTEGTNITYYEWTVPAGWNILSGQGTTQITVTPTATAVSGDISLSGGNGCTFNSTIRTLAVTPTDIPEKPASSAGSEIVCPSSNVTYTVTNVAGTTYTWDYPSDWTVTSSANAYSRTFSIGTSGGQVKVTPSNACGTGQPYIWNVTASEPDWARLRQAVETGNANVITLYKRSSGIEDDYMNGTFVLCQEEDFINSDGTAINVSRTVTIQSVNSNDTIRLNTPTGTERHFNVITNGDFTLKSLVIDGMNNAGGITANAPLTINNVVFRNCVTSGEGGAIYMSVPINLKVGSNVHFINNYAPQAYWINAADAPYLTVAATAIMAHAAHFVIPASLSKPPAGNLPFIYAYNNYDVNYIGDNNYNLPTIRGTVFPFVKRTLSDIYCINFNDKFPITVSLKAVPATKPVSDSELIAFFEQAPLFSTIAEYYDGTKFMANTPEHPGTLGEFNNYGEPINFGAIGKTHNPETPVFLSEGNPAVVIEGATVGLFEIPDVPAGEYILEIFRNGYVVRWAKITVDLSNKIQYFGHRELVPGNIVNLPGSTMKIFDDDAQIIRNYVKKGTYYGHPDYKPEYDLNADGLIDIYDYYLLMKYHSFMYNHYMDTYSW